MKSPLFWALIAIISVISISLIFEASYADGNSIPQWIKNNAKLWSDNQITDSDFIKAIQYLIDKKILVVANSNQITDNGDFKVTYQAVTDPQYQNMAQSMQQSRGFDAVANILNQDFILPNDVTISFSQCGQANAFYDPNSKQLTMCYELLTYFVKLYSSTNETQNDVIKNTAGAGSFVFFHELGHALIDVYHLPTTGKEEDAVDQLSTIILLNYPSGDSAISATEIWFLSQGLQKNNVSDLAFWNEHSLDLERFYNIACLAYGKDPVKYGGFVTLGVLPSERAVRCAGEYQKAHDSWNVLLQPYVKTNSILQ